MKRLSTALFAAVALWGAPAGAETIRLGVTAGPHAEIAEAIVPVAKAKGLDLKVVEFSEGTRVNIALQDGELDADAFQHKPYLNSQTRARNLTLASVADTVLMPMAVYSKRFKSLQDLPDKAHVLIPNDPANAGRALKLLEQGGLLKLKPGVSSDATVFDIVENPKGLKVTELEGVQIPRSLQDVDLAVLNTHHALHAGLNPVKDSVLRETVQSEYLCLIAVRQADKDKPWVKILAESYRSPEVKAFIERKYDGAILASW
jgi:ABC-type metal ion transport system, periplasmic component/surface antigen